MEAGVATPGPPVGSAAAASMTTWTLPSAAARTCFSRPHGTDQKLSPLLHPDPISEGFSKGAPHPHPGAQTVTRCKVPPSGVVIGNTTPQEGH